LCELRRDENRAADVHAGEAAAGDATHARPAMARLR
jgi:hypothetical protein